MNDAENLRVTQRHCCNWNEVLKQEDDDADQFLRFAALPDIERLTLAVDDVTGGDVPRRLEHESKRAAHGNDHVDETSTDPRLKDNEPFFKRSND